MASHEPAIQSVQEAGEKLMDVSNLGVPEIEQVRDFVLFLWFYIVLLKWLFLIKAIEITEPSLGRIKTDVFNSR